MKKLLILIFLFTLATVSGCTLVAPPATNENVPQVDSADNVNQVPSQQPPAQQPVSGKDSLDLSDQGLSKLPSYVLDMTNLQELNISNNQLTGALPAEIRFLQNLRVLNASNNQMTGVPAEIGQLSRLETLNLANNQLTGLPYELGNLKNLRVLNLSGNNHSQQDLAIIREGLSKDVTIIE